MIAWRIEPPCSGARGLRRANTVLSPAHRGGRGLSRAIIALALNVSLAAQAGPVPPAPPAGTIVLVTDRALDGRGSVLRGSRIAVSGGKITSLNASGGDMTIDLSRYTVLPGWIDTHVHLDSHWDRNGRIATESEPVEEAALGIAGNAWATLMAGFTTVQSVGAPS